MQLIVWTFLETHSCGDTSTVKVPGGRLYRIREWNPYDENQAPAVSLVFVPGEAES